VRAVNPGVAVFSVPRDSRLGHLQPAVLQRDNTLGVCVLRTDEHGAITVRTDGQSAWIEPYIGEPAMLSAPVAPHVVETLQRLQRALKRRDSGNRCGSRALPIGDRGGLCRQPGAPAAPTVGGPRQ
jgi:hypothetical protein